MADKDNDNDHVDYNDDTDDEDDEDDDEDDDDDNDEGENSPIGNRPSICKLHTVANHPLYIATTSEPIMQVR